MKDRTRNARRTPCQPSLVRPIGRRTMRKLLEALKQMRAGNVQVLSLSEADAIEFVGPQSSKPVVLRGARRRS